jgi:hypothetical protein
MAFLCIAHCIESYPPRSSAHPPPGSRLHPPPPKKKSAHERTATFSTCFLMRGRNFRLMPRQDKKLSCFLLVARKSYMNCSSWVRIFAYMAAHIRVKNQGISKASPGIKE